MSKVKFSSFDALKAAIQLSAVTGNLDTITVYFKTHATIVLDDYIEFFNRVHENDFERIVIRFKDESTIEMRL